MSPFPELSKCFSRKLKLLLASDLSFLYRDECGMSIPVYLFLIYFVACLYSNNVICFSCGYHYVFLVTVYTSQLHIALGPVSKHCQVQSTVDMLLNFPGKVSFCFS